MNRLGACVCPSSRQRLTFDWLQDRLGRKGKKDKAPVPDRAQPVRLEKLIL